MLSLTEHLPRVFDKGQQSFVRKVLNFVCRCVVPIISHRYSLDYSISFFISDLNITIRCFSSAFWYSSECSSSYTFNCYSFTLSETIFSISSGVRRAGLLLSLSNKLSSSTPINSRRTFSSYMSLNALKSSGKSIYSLS